LIEDKDGPLLIARELVAGLMLNNYGQDWRTANGLVCMTAVAPLAAGGSEAAWSVAGGNEYLFSQSSGNSCVVLSAVFRSQCSSGQKLNGIQIPTELRLHSSYEI
jgi:hypothetical protein